MLTFSRFASESEIAERKRATLAFLHLDEPDSVHPRQKAEPLSPDLASYLNLIADTPGMPSSMRDKKANMASKTGKALTERLLELGMIIERSIKSNGPGRPIKDLQLTEAGRKAIENFSSGI